MLELSTIAIVGGTEAEGSGLAVSRRTTFKHLTRSRWSSDAEPRRGTPKPKPPRLCNRLKYEA
jgi:hypothetical protein